MKDEGKEMIPFNIPPYTGNEEKYIADAIGSHKICGDGKYTHKCSSWMEEKFGANKILLTTSGSSALDMSAFLCNIMPNDEVILPSFTFSSTANAFVLAGAKLIFVDIRPDTMNIDESKIEAAISNKTKVIVPVHYAGVSCEMDVITDIAKTYNLRIVEDAAQGVMSTYKGKALGAIGDFGCYSFHETKNYSMGEGGAIVINKPDCIEKAEILREKGTNRSKFYRGQIDKYTWVDFGDSFLPSELNAAYLWAQLEKAEEVNRDRIKTWNNYYHSLSPLQDRELIELPQIPDGCVHNAHMFYIKLHNIDERTKFIEYMKANNIMTVFHYLPLHSSPGGLKYGKFIGEDKYTTRESERLVRLPLYYGIEEKDVNYIVEKTYDFFKYN